MSTKSKIALASSIAFATVSVYGVFLYKEASLDIRRVGISRDDRKRAQREANQIELQRQMDLRSELEIDQKVNTD